MKKLLLIPLLAMLVGCSELASYFDDAEPDAPPIPATGPRLLSVKFEDNGKYITWKAEGISHWKNNKNGVSAWIVINGVEVENIRDGYTRQHIENAYGPANDHGVPGLKNGKEVEVKLRKIDRKEETNPLPMVWKGKDT